MDHTRIRRSIGGNAFLYEMAKKLGYEPQDILAGWPHDYIRLQNIQDMLSTFHELGLNEPNLDPKRRWHLAGNIVARIDADNRDR